MWLLRRSGRRCRRRRRSTCASRLVGVVAVAGRRAGRAAAHAAAPCARGHRGGARRRSSGSRPNCAPAGRLPTAIAGDRERRRSARRRLRARAIARTELGASLPDALAAWARERAGAGHEPAAGALAVAHEVGGRSADGARQPGGVAARPARRSSPKPMRCRPRPGTRRSSSGSARSPTSRFSVLVDPRAADALSAPRRPHVRGRRRRAREWPAHGGCAASSERGAGVIALVSLVGWGSRSALELVLGAVSPASAVARARAARRARGSSTARATPRVACRAHRPLSAPVAVVAPGRVDAVARRRRARRDATMPCLPSCRSPSISSAVAVGAGCTPFRRSSVAARWSPPQSRRARRRRSRAPRSGASFDDALRDAGAATPSVRRLTERCARARGSAHPSAASLARLAAGSARRCPPPGRSPRTHRSGAPALPPRVLCPACVRVAHGRAGAARWHRRSDVPTDAASDPYRR